MLGVAQKIRVLYSEHGENAETNKTETPRPQAKQTSAPALAGLAVALLGVLMALGVYVALDAKITTLAQSVSGLPAKISALDAKVAHFENLPDKMRRQMVADRLAEMADTAQRLTAGLDTADQKALMHKISDMARELESNVSK